MKNIPDGRMLSQIIMLGSHDSGIDEVNVTGRNLGVFAKGHSITQELNLGGQLQHGARMFDLRYAASNWRESRRTTASVRSYHATARQGAYGSTLQSDLAHLASWIQENPTETAIIRISHTDKNISKFIQDTIAADSILCNKLLKNNCNLATQPLSSVRGKILFCFEKGHNAVEGFHCYDKFKQGGNQNGFITCGKYSDEYRLEKVMAKQLLRVNDHVHHVECNASVHFFVLYWTQTGGNIKANTMAAAAGSSAAGNSASEAPPNANAVPAPLVGGTINNFDAVRDRVLEATFARNVTVKVNSAPSERSVVLNIDPAVRMRFFPSIILMDFIGPRTDNIANQIIALNSNGRYYGILPANEVDFREL